jgi:hypothetical protein
VLPHAILVSGRPELLVQDLHTTAVFGGEKHVSKPKNGRPRPGARGSKGIQMRYVVASGKHRQGAGRKL